MTESALLAVDPPVVDRLLMIEVWEDVAGVAVALAAPLGTALPRPLGAVAWGAGALLWWEGGQWLWRTEPQEAEARRAEVETALGGSGILADISGGFRRIRVRGLLWRELLMIESWFDAGSLSVGQVAGTVIHHTSLRIHALSDFEAHLYVPASLSEWLFEALTGDAGRLLFDVAD